MRTVTGDRMVYMLQQRLLAERRELYELLAASQALLDDVKRRHPGEELRCPYMRALEAAVVKTGIRGDKRQ